MRVFLAIACLSLGCSSSSTNNSNDQEGGSGGVDAASGGTAALDSGNGGSGGLDASVPEGASGTGAGDPCAKTHVVINEISPTGYTPNDEFIELYNPGPDSVNLGDYYLDYKSKDGQGSETLWSGAGEESVEGHAFFVIRGTEFNGIYDSMFAANLSIEDAGGVQLRAPEGILDAVAWGDVVDSHLYKEGTAASAPGVGASIGRMPDGHDCENNSSDFTPNLTRTPGEPNSY